MARIIRLTESDMSRLVKRVIKEQRDEEIAQKIENIVDSPKVENHLEQILNNMGEDEIEDIKQMLTNLGIDENSSIQDIHKRVLQYSALMGLHDYESDGEMIEDYVNSNKGKTEEKNPKQKVAEILHSIGAGNIAAWGGVPAAIAIGSATGMPMGFAISWGVTGLLMGLAHLMEKK